MSERDDLEIFASHGRVNRPAHRRKADAAYWRVRPLLLDSEVAALAVARSHIGDGREGRAEFVRVCAAVRARLSGGRP